MRRVSALIVVSTAFVLDLTLAASAQAAKLEPQLEPIHQAGSLVIEPESGTLAKPLPADLSPVAVNLAAINLSEINLSEINLAEAPLRRPRSNSRPESSSSDRSISPSRSNQTGSNQTGSNQAAFNYRLVIQGSGDSLLRQVRRIVPDAFRTTIDGRRVIQAGLFVEREEAEAIQRQLNQIDAETDILDLEQPIVQRSSRSALSSVPSSTTRQTGFNYRLVIQGSSDSLLRQVRRIVPDAFRTTIDGRRVIQAGLFVEQEEAEVVQSQLNRIDAEIKIFDVSYGITARQTAPQSLTRARDGRVVVVVDPGHGGRDPGAVGIGGIQEASIVLDIAQQVATLLEEQGVQAILTRSDDREIDLQPRVSLAESVNATVFVSIHANAISLSRPDVNGIETYYYDTGAALASAIHNSLVNTTGMNDRGVRQARFYVLTRTSMPAVLVEVGFVTGQEDAAKLRNTAFRSQIAAGIAQGILRYIR